MKGGKFAAVNRLGWKAEWKVGGWKTIGIAILLSFLGTDISSAEQGTAIQLNGQTWAGQWLRRVDGGQPSIFVQDQWMEGAIGVDLLDSEQAERQRLKWFSSPFFAAVSYDRPVMHRFLDIKALGKEWRTEIEGNTLKISTPDVTVQTIRRAKQEWGDRVVIDLSNRTPWQIQQQRDMVVLTLAAELAPGAMKGSTTDKGNFIKAFDVQSQGKQTILRIQSTEALQPQIETLGDPARIILDLRRDYVPPSQNIVWAEGLRRRAAVVAIPNVKPKTDKDPKVLRFPVVALQVNLKQPGLTMRPIWSNPNGMQGTSSLRAMSEQWQVAAAINAGFFNRDRKLPVGPIKDNFRWIAGPVLTRGAIAWNGEGDIFMDRLIFAEELSTGSTKPIPLTNLNSGYVQKGVARYTTTWGSTYTPLTDNEVFVTVQGDRVVSQVRGGATGQGQVAIPPNGYLLVVRQTPEIVAQLSAGVQVKGRTSIKPNTFTSFPHLVGAGPLLVKNGAVVLDAAIERFQPPFDKQGASRSFVAALKDEGTLLLATVQATPEGLLPTLAQTAEIAKKLGAIDALNLDGGGSTTLYLGGSILNRNLENVGPIHNALGIFISPAEGQQKDPGQF